MTLNDLVQRFAAPMATAASPAQLLNAAAAWGALQHARARTRPRRRVPAEEAALPGHAERWLRFTASTFGTAWFAGLLDGFSLSAAQRASAARQRGGGPAEAALACAGVDGNVEVIAFEQRTNELFAPGYLVAVDHDHGVAIVALRGTSSVSDALSDLTCKPASVQLGGHSGLAHDGMWRAAERLEGKLAELAEEALGRLVAGVGARRVIITGHSLGAGVAALVAAQWRDRGRFAGGAVECVAFACPQVLDAELAQAQSNHTTTVIFGDDMVPRFSLATAHDLRAAMLLLSDPASGGLSASFGADAILDLQTRGEEDTLAAASDVVRPRVCTAEGRLFPSGRLVHLRQGEAPTLAALDEVDELHISSDMAAAHMPRRYLLAVLDASAAAAGATDSGATEGRAAADRAAAAPEPGANRGARVGEL